MERFESFIFDLDGTLVDNMPLHNRIWAEFLERRLGLSLSPEEVGRRTAALHNVQIIRMFFGLTLSLEECLSLAEEKESIYRQRSGGGGLTPLPGVTSFIERSRIGGRLLALASSSSRRNVFHTLDIIGIQGFNCIVGSDDVTKGKPDPEPFLFVARQLTVEPRKCLVFEDSLNGLRAARSAGMKAVAVQTSHVPEELRTFENVVDVISDYSGFIDLPESHLDRFI